MRVEGEKRYALLLAAKDSDYVKKVYGGYFNVFVEAFGEEGERWDLFRVVEGEFPEINDLQNYHGFVISGSPFDAYGNDLWILRLCFLLQTLDAMEKKVLGICFGHQVLCRALGGKVGRAYSGWDIGLRKVKMVEDLPACSFLDGLKEIPPCLSIIECHQDEVRSFVSQFLLLYVCMQARRGGGGGCGGYDQSTRVWEIPLGAEVIAFSEKTGVEMFAIGDHILGIQGHPEYTKDIMYNLIDRLLKNNSIERRFAEDAKLILAVAEPDRKSWERICRSFLKGT
ncbi:hypothetical protein HHK36_006428 [Tetracentron sinense]|uniref:Glutamine amidotransferase domain-containing protein n=1 Tax=Tetracentron sinense TaxID=13715 RepID=A0A834ZPL9_TETSI|nr:hypothetical protein HHK36_006428 [Tetracentron sinense]